MGPSTMAPSWQAEFDQFPEYYAEYFKKYSSAVAPLRRIICKSPISYVGHELLQTDIANLKAAVDGLRRHRRVHAVVGSERVRPQRVLRQPRGVPRRRRRGDARGIPRHRRRRIHPAGRRPVADRHAVAIRHARWRSATEAANAHVDAAQPRAARHPDRPRASPHLLRPQPRPAPHRHRRCATRCRSCCASTPAPTRSRSPTRATSTSTGSGRTSSCPTTRSSSRA